jgi:hypothetical protein
MYNLYMGVVMPCYYVCTYIYIYVYFIYGCSNALLLCMYIYIYMYILYMGVVMPCYYVCTYIYIYIYVYLIYGCSNALLLCSMRPMRSMRGGLIFRNRGPSLKVHHGQCLTSMYVHI